MHNAHDERTQTWLSRSAALLPLRHKRVCDQAAPSRQSPTAVPPIDAAACDQAAPSRQSLTAASPTNAAASAAHAQNAPCHSGLLRVVPPHKALPGTRERRFPALMHHPPASRRSHCYTRPEAPRTAANGTIAAASHGDTRICKRRAAHTVHLFWHLRHAQRAAVLQVGASDLLLPHNAPRVHRWLRVVSAMLLLRRDVRVPLAPSEAHAPTTRPSHAAPLPR
ncbi:hypothetical protein JKP88DRAFT_253766 [Tribonema minus]|uniref:Uncharacterized protein n=1 Tax=Tribonema minus TaxID=303371 RepID=A0A836CJM0_9STRA|nr:hypothetical protein JKP88DRAFT_253766 [Tribonema minus]